MDPSTENRFLEELVNRGLIKRKDLLTALRERELEREETGRNLNLGQVLLRNGIITGKQYVQTSEAIGNRIMRCPSCESMYSMGTATHSESCSCGTPLVSAAALEEDSLNRSLSDSDFSALGDLSQHKQTSLLSVPDWESKGAPPAPEDPGIQQTMKLPAVQNRVPQSPPPAPPPPQATPAPIKQNIPPPPPMAPQNPMAGNWMSQPPVQQQPMRPSPPNPLPLPQAPGQGQPGLPPPPMPYQSGQFPGFMSQPGLPVPPPPPPSMFNSGATPSMFNSGATPFMPPPPQHGAGHIPPPPPHHRPGSGPNFLSPGNPPPPPHGLNKPPSGAQFIAPPSPGSLPVPNGLNPPSGAIPRPSSLNPAPPTGNDMTGRQALRAIAPSAMNNGGAAEATPQSQGYPFGDYVLFEELGRGASGAVFRSRLPQSGQVVALKILNDELKGNERATKRFMREGKLLSKLKHPNIVQVYDYGTVDSRCYLVMDLIEGISLDDRLKKGRIEVNPALELLQKLCHACGHAHDQNIVHRDLKPDNVMLRDGLEPILTDFGLARGEEMGLTRSGTAVGTPYFMSPEQIQGQRDVDHRADVYSLGVIAYRIFTGKLPFTAKSAYELYNKVLKEEPIEATKLNSKLDPAVDLVLLRAMNKDRARRYQTMNAFAEDLGCLLAGEKPKYASRSKSKQRRGWFGFGKRN